ncbi:MAG: flavodoxin family protein [Clostridiales bacterium]|nr:flavodoxin family protein [Clostridiales bacterium]
MKKAVVLNASPNPDGSTAQLISAFTHIYNEKLIVYNMYNEKIAPCIGCNRCADGGKCFMSDTNGILNDIFTADFLIFASPVYNYSFPSPMKAFLDRLQPYFFSESSQIERKGFLLVTCGKSGKYSIEIMEKQTKTAFSELSAEFCGSYVFANTDKRNTLQQNEIRKAESLAKEFFGIV